MLASCEAVAQGRALGLGPMANGGRESAGDGRADGVESLPAAQTLAQAQRKLTRSHWDSEG